MKEYFVKRIRELAAELEQYNDDLDSFGNALSVQKIKNLEASIYQNFEAVGKIKEKMNYLTFSNFPTQRLQLIKLLQSFAEQLEKQYQLSKDLSKAVWLGKTLLSLQLMKRNVDKLIKTVDVTDPKAWKKPLPAFEVFQKHMVEDLESSLKMLGASAEELDKISKRAAAK